MRKMDKIDLTLDDVFIEKEEDEERNTLGEEYEKIKKYRDMLKNNCHRCGCILIDKNSCLCSSCNLELEKEYGSSFEF